MRRRRNEKPTIRQRTCGTKRAAARLHPPDRTDEAIDMADPNPAQESSARDTPDSYEESNTEQPAPQRARAMAQRMTKTELLAELLARDAELARLRNDLESRDARVDELFELLADSHNNDATRSRRRETTAETHPTVATQRTQQSARSEGEGGRRSGKLPDPPIFCNDELDPRRLGSCPPFTGHLGLLCREIISYINPSVSANTCDSWLHVLRSPDALPFQREPLTVADPGLVPVPDRALRPRPRPRPHPATVGYW